MMTFIIHCNDDSLTISADTVDEIRAIAMSETAKRGWPEADCWSERVNG
jgi:hypothetical protein